MTIAPDDISCYRNAHLLPDRGPVQYRGTVDGLDITWGTDALVDLYADQHDRYPDWFNKQVIEAIADEKPIRLHFTYRDIDDNNVGAALNTVTELIELVHGLTVKWEHHDLYAVGRYVEVGR